MPVAPANPFGASSRHDIFLSPHSDDICFSLGHLARLRGAGTLVTVFPVSNYRTDPPRDEAFTTRGTTLRRLSEDSRFAGACGLAFGMLEHSDAVVRNHHPFDAQHAERVSREIDVSLMRAVSGPAIARVVEPRPWLFCPAGIGGHVDHLAVLMAVWRNLPAIEACYRVGFYEDLHYASVAQRREQGLRVLRAVTAGRILARQVVALDGAEARSAKMRLVNLYASQLTEALRSIASFTPAVTGEAKPHEAVWVLQEDMHQRPG